MYALHPDCWTKNLTIGVFCMTKYDYELKKRVVTAYLNGDGGYKFISKKYDISDKLHGKNKSQIMTWFTSLAPFGRCCFVYSIDSSIVRSIGLDSPQFEASDNFFLISAMSFCSSFLFSIDELVAGLYELVSLLQPTKNTEATIRNILTTLDFITKPP